MPTAYCHTAQCPQLLITQLPVLDRMFYKACT